MGIIDRLAVSAQLHWLIIRWRLIIPYGDGQADLWQNRRQGYSSGGIFGGIF